MAKQLHRSFHDQQVRSLLQSYIDKEVELSYLLDILKIGRSRFFALLKAYRHNPTESERTSSLNSPGRNKIICCCCAGRASLFEAANPPIYLERA